MGLICKWCTDKGRTSKPELVHYIDLRSSGRRSSFFCSACDCTARWPNFARTSPKVPKER